MSASGPLPGGEKNRVILLYVFLLSFNVAAWVTLWLLSGPYPYLLTLGFLSYVFGLRHAADADHIAAIDNTTRKLVHEGKGGMGIGLFFSLGHSTVVTAMAGFVVIATAAVRASLPNLAAVGGILGSSVSALFLYLIAVINLVILRDVWGIFRMARSAGLDEAKTRELEELLLQRGLMNRFFGRMFRTVTRSWHMYPVGLLFGLGFDTASEVALLGFAAAAAAHNMPLADILVLPWLFAAGMSLVDTTDGVVMRYAYNWAFLKPVRKVFYNLAITGVSVFLALVVGSIEWLQVISARLSLQGYFWTFVQNISFTGLGYVIMGVLAGGWLLAALIYRVKDFDGKYGLNGQAN